jgi:hypothetical protein
MFENGFAQWIVVALIGVITYFLKQLHTDFKKLAEKNVQHDKLLIQLTEKVINIESKQVNDMQQITKIFELRLESVQKELEHINANIKQSNKGSTDAILKMIDYMERQHQTR